MSRKRRRFDGEFKSKVALKAIRGLRTSASRQASHITIVSQGGRMLALESFLVWAATPLCLACFVAIHNVASKHILATCRNGLTFVPELVDEEQGHACFRGNRRVLKHSLTTVKL